MYILVARLSGPAEYGTIIAAIALGMTLCTFLDFGSNSLWVREGASGRLAAAELGNRAASKIAISALALLAWTCVGVFLPVPNLWVSGPVALSVLFSLTSQVGPRRVGLIGVVSISILADRVIGAVTLAALIFVFAIDPISALWIALIVGSASGAVVCWFATPRNDRLPLKLMKVSNPWRGGGYYGLSGVAAGIQSLEMQVIAGIGGAPAAGLYGAVNRWTQPLGLLSNAFASASVPFVAAASSWASAWPTVRRAIWLPITAMCAAIVCAASAPIIVPLLLGDAYLPSVVVLQILAVGTIAGIANQPIAVFLQARNRDRLVSFVLLSTAILNLLSVGLLTLLYGAFGAAAGSASAQIITLLSLIFFASRRSTPPAVLPAA